MKKNHKQVYAEELTNMCKDRVVSPDVMFRLLEKERHKLFRRGTQMQYLIDEEISKTVSDENS